MDKRPALFVVPRDKIAIHTLLFNIENTSNQYNFLGIPVTQVNNEIRLFKTVFRKRFLPQTELCLEIPFFIERTLKTTLSNNTSFFPFNDESGPGDISLGITQEFIDGRKNDWGLISGIEIKLPTGDAEKGIGSDSLDFIARTTVTKKTELGISYFKGIYTISGKGYVNDVRVYPGNDLYLALGISSKRFHSLSIDLNVFKYIRTNDFVRESGGFALEYEKYNIPGFKSEIQYHYKNIFEIFFSYQESYPENHIYTFQNNSFISKHDAKSVYCLTLRYFL